MKHPSNGLYGRRPARRPTGTAPAASTPSPAPPSPRETFRGDDGGRPAAPAERPYRAEPDAGEVRETREPREPRAPRPERGARPSGRAPRPSGPNGPRPDRPQADARPRGERGEAGARGERAPRGERVDRGERGRRRRRPERSAEAPGARYGQRPGAAPGGNEAPRNGRGHVRGPERAGSSPNRIQGARRPEFGERSNERPRGAFRDRPSGGDRTRSDGYGGGNRPYPSSGRPERGYDRPRRTRERRELPFTDLLKELQQQTSIDPTERLKLETTPDRLTTRCLDLVTPIGKGQRCLIVAPPKAGKTTLLQDVAVGLAENHPEVEVIVLLVDERPEEVTHFRRSVPCEVMAASSDQTAAEHVEMAEQTLARVLVPVLDGKHVVVLLDSITRLARAYNTNFMGIGRTLTGGLDAATMQIPRQIFGAARNIENGGSLTILGTALVDTGSRMDEVIFQEFKGTGNMELILSRQLFEKRVFPCIDIKTSGTRKEEKLYSPEETRALHALRRRLVERDPEAGMLELLELLRQYPTNELLLSRLMQ